MSQLVSFPSKFTYIGKVSFAIQGKRKQVLALAKSNLKAVDVEKIANDVFCRLNSIDVVTLWESSGRGYYGYNDPTEVAAEMIENEIEPFVQEAKKRHEVARYEDVLKPVYEQELLGIYEQAVVEMARPTSGRLGYQEIVKKLQRMLSYSGGEACVLALLAIVLVIREAYTFQCKQNNAELVVVCSKKVAGGFTIIGGRNEDLDD